MKTIFSSKYYLILKNVHGLNIDMKLKFGLFMNYKLVLMFPNLYYFFYRFHVKNAKLLKICRFDILNVCC